MFRVVSPLLFVWVAALLGCASVSEAKPAWYQQTTCTPARSGSSLLVLVNKEPIHQLEKHWHPNDLIHLRPDLMIPNRKGKLRKEAARALSAMIRSARSERQDIRVRSSFRSYRTQAVVFQGKIRKLGESRARGLSAEAGHSQHQLGTTVDLTAKRLGWQLSPRLSETPEGRWLRDNAHRFGFVLSYPKGAKRVTGYVHEPWHYRYIGREAAAEMHRENLLLETYLQRCDQCDKDLLCPRR